MEKSVAEHNPDRRRGADHEQLPGSPLEAMRFRLRRHPVPEAHREHLRVSFQMPEGGSLQCRLLDLSELTLGIEVSPEVVLEAGTRLRHLEVLWEGRAVFHGSAVVGRPVGTEERLELILEHGHLPVEALLNPGSSVMASPGEDLDLLIELLEPGGIPEAYRAVTADHALLLETMGRLLSSRVRPGRNERRPDRVLDEVGRELLPRFLRIVSAMNEAMAGASKEVYELSARYAKALTVEAWQECPLFLRAYEKPLGYAGDYLLMHQIYSRSDEAPTLRGRLLSRFFLELPVVRAGVSRVPFLAAMLHEECMARRGRPVRIASLACGPAEELALLFRRLEGEVPELSIALLDQDREALSFCQRRFLRLDAETGMPPGVRVECYNVAVRAILGAPAQVREALGAFHIFYAVGLFDYLSDSVASRLVAALAMTLEPGGLLIVGNFAPHNAMVLMDHMADWRLICRDRDALRRMGEQATAGLPGRFSVEVTAEQVGLMLFLRVRREA